MRRTWIAGAAFVAGGLLFGLFGGEYSTPNWWQLRHDVKSEQAALDRLHVEVDSLRRVAKALETDSATQERVARERFGMLRPGERLYQLVPADSSQP